MTGKSDALSVVSYGSFALTSVSMSRELELGFETGFTTFFLQLFAAQVYKIKWFLLPIALLFCCLIIILRHNSESRVQFGSSIPNRFDPLEDGPTNEAVIEIGEEGNNVERQSSPGMGEVSRQSLLSTNNQPNRQDEASEAIGEVSAGSMSNWDNQEEQPSSLATEYSFEEDEVSLGNYGWMNSSPPPQLPRMSSRPGDWNCKSCQHLNFQRRDSCQRCGESKYGEYYYGVGGGGASSSFRGPDVRPGDWYCAANNCGSHNFASRSSCFKCAAFKDDLLSSSFNNTSDFLLRSGPAFASPPSSTSPSWKSGDWICNRLGCNEYNFASRMECFKCSAPRGSY